MHRGAHLTLWWIATLLAPLGIGGLVAGSNAGFGALALSWLIYLNMAWINYPGRAAREFPVGVVAAGIFGGMLLALAAAPGVERPARVALACSGLQTLLGAAAARAGAPNALLRRAIDVLGHASVLLASGLWLAGAPIELVVRFTWAASASCC